MPVKHLPQLQTTKTTSLCQRTRRSVPSLGEPRPGPSCMHKPQPELQAACHGRMSACVQPLKACKHEDACRCPPSPAAQTSAVLATRLISSTLPKPYMLYRPPRPPHSQAHQLSSPSHSSMPAPLHRPLLQQRPGPNSRPGLLRSRRSRALQPVPPPTNISRKQAQRSRASLGLLEVVVSRGPKLACMKLVLVSPERACKVLLQSTAPRRGQV